MAISAVPLLCAALWHLRFSQKFQQTAPVDLERTLRKAAQWSSQVIAPSADTVLLLHEAHRPPSAARRRGHTDLGMTIIGITPASAFEQTMRCSDLTKGNPARQIAALIDHTATRLTNVQRFSAWMLARD
jgi:hypothetical protein